MAIRVLDANRKTAKASALALKFNGRIVGQEAAREALIHLLDKFTSGMYNTRKPIGSLLFLGPTGSGKTLVAEAFSEGLFGSPDKMLKVDCAEFQHSHEIAKLVGSPPGYLGHRETHPYFTNDSLFAARSDDKAVEIMPFTVVLFDEIEKASDALWNLLLGILDKGTLTTGTNQKVDFTKTVIMMTSNVGAAELSDDSVLGFNSGEKVVDDKKMADIAMSAARKKFMPEFLNRLDKIVMFKTLGKVDLQRILDLELDKIQDRILAGSRIMFEMRVTTSALTQLVEAGYDKRYNARHLVRAVEKFVADPLTRLVSTQQIHEDDLVVVDYIKDKDEWKYVAAPRSPKYVN
jgi:ATP-dependent Clp protease ATP-binding subunit ClpB